MRNYDDQLSREVDGDRWFAIRRHRKAGETCGDCGRALTSLDWTNEMCAGFRAGPAMNQRDEKRGVRGGAGDDPPGTNVKGVDRRAAR